MAPVKGAGWTIKVATPADGGRQLIGDITSLWSPLLQLTAPPTVFTEIKRDAKHITVHLLNYAPQPVAKGVRIDLAADPQAPPRRADLRRPWRGKRPCR